MPNPTRRRRLGTGSAFVPPQWSNLQFWGSADVGVYTDTALTTPAVGDGTGVGGWRDQGPSAHHATQATGARQPLLKISVLNGKPSLLFQVANTHWLGFDSVAAAFSGSSLPLTVMTVLKQTSVASAQVHVGLGAAGTTPSWIFDVGSGVVWGSNKVADAAGGNTNVTGGTPDTSPHIVTFISPGTTLEINVDGVQIVAPTTQNRAPTTLTTAAIGAVNTNGAATQFLNGNIFELFVWSIALTTGEQQAVRRAMAKKYGISST